MINLVNRLQFEMTCNGEASAFNMRKHFTQVQQLQIQEAIENVCSKYVAEDESIQLNKLVINLGHLNMAVFEKDFERLFKQKFEQQLTEQLSKFSQAERQESKMRSGVEMTQFFLLNGYLPWWANEMGIDFEIVVLQALAQQREMMYRFLARRTTLSFLWKRMAYQFSQPALEIVISMFSTLVTRRNQWQRWTGLLKESLNKMQKAEKALGLVEWFLTHLNELIISNASEWLGKGETKLLFAETFFGCIDTQITAEDSGPKHVNDLLNQAIKALAAGDFAEAGAGEDSVEMIGGAKNKTESIINPEARVPGDSNQIIEDGILNDIDEKERIMVFNAGIILLSPFLKTFFLAVGLFDKNEWTDKLARVKAVQLLHYLATGKMECREYSAVLEKILCGVPLQEAIPVDIMLSEQEKEEADTLLRSVIGHWKVLKNTSLPGLRESFLARQGMVYKIENGWMLRVERKTMDVLLDSIPWGFSTANLPWNNYLIITEW